MTKRRSRVMEAWLQFKTHWGVRFVHSLVVGALGTLFVAFFFSGFMGLETVLGFLPWVVAFNGAMAGFMFSDKTRLEKSRTLQWAAVCGTGVGTLSYVFTNSLFFHLYEMPVLGAKEVLLYVVVSMVGAMLGSLLSMKAREGG